MNIFASVFLNFLIHHITVAVFEYLILRSYTQCKPQNEYERDFSYKNGGRIRTTKVFWVT